MKIADYTLAMQTGHQLSQQSSVSEKLRIWADRPAPAHPAPASSEQVTLSAAAQQKQASETAAIDDASGTASNDPKLQLLILMVERMTGHKVQIFDSSQLKHASCEKIAAPAAGNNYPAPPSRAGFGVDYSKVCSYSEFEQTTLQASGTIKTSDGKEIQFSLTLVMQRQYSETSSTSVRLGDAARKTDPLVINFNGSAAQLSEQRFAFDLNADGQNEQINAPLAGSGFLALDKNGDGTINNGSELFGSSTGNGYSELAQYDSDQNGWIDESDPVFKMLQVWAKDAGGSGKLSDLAALGIGAISLQAASTPFDIKTTGNQLLGSIRSSSVVINENGTVGSMQQIDLTV